MKKKQHLILLLPVIQLVFACANKKQAHHSLELNKETNKILINGKTTVVNISTNEIDTNVLSINYTYFNNPSVPWQDSVNKQISVYFSDMVGKETVKNIKVDSLFFKHILVETKKLNHEQNGEFNSLFEFEASVEIDTSFNTFSQLSMDAYTYFGGAHPNTYTVHQLLSKKNGKVLLLKDIISDTIAFNRIAERCFREQNDLPNDDFSSLDFWFPNNEFSCPDYFLITNDAIHFHFNTYEIAPYVMGSFEFSVPFTLSKHLIQLDLSKN